MRRLSAGGRETSSATDAVFLKSDLEALFIASRSYAVRSRSQSGRGLIEMSVGPCARAHGRIETISLHGPDRNDLSRFCHCGRDRDRDSRHRCLLAPCRLRGARPATHPRVSRTPAGSRGVAHPRRHGAPGATPFLANRREAVREIAGFAPTLEPGKLPARHGVESSTGLKTGAAMRARRWREAARAEL